MEEIESGTVGAVKLYVKWLPNEYTITFDANESAIASGVVEQTMDDIECKYGKSVILPANAFKPQVESALKEDKMITTYIFKGWNTKPDGSGISYANKATVKNLTAEDGGSVTLYAQWQPVNFTVKYVLNNGVNSPLNDLTLYNADYCKDSDSFELKDPTRAGYTFEGWYADPKFEGSEITVIAFDGSYGNVVLYAKWAKAETTE